MGNSASSGSIQYTQHAQQQQALSLGFGVEIEIAAMPRSSSMMTGYGHKARYLRNALSALNSALTANGIPASTARINDNLTFTKHNGDYNSWHLTRDSSLRALDQERGLAFEVASRILRVQDDRWVLEVRKFWEVLNSQFRLDARNLTCGCHIHVAPAFGLYNPEELKTIAYAVIIYEKHVRAFIKPERRGKHYCRTNTTLSPRLRQVFEPGRSRITYARVANELHGIMTPEALCQFMQGNERRVLWNFSNIVSGRIGTIEFRGGPQLHTATETIRWVLFAVGFIELALTEDEFGSGEPFTYTSPQSEKFQQRAQELWQRIRICARNRITQRVMLPATYQEMWQH